MADRPGNFNPDAYQKALESSNKILSNHKEIERYNSNSEKAWNAISSNIFKISGAEWFKKVKKTPQDIANIREGLSELRIQVQNIGSELDKSFTQNFKDIQKDFARIANFDLSKGVRNMTASIGTLSETSIQQLSDVIENKIGKSLDEISLVDLKEQSSDLLENFSLYKDQLSEISQQQLQDVLDKTQLQLDSYTDIGDQMGAIEQQYSDILNISDQQLRKDLALAIAKGELSDFVEKYGEKASYALELFGKIDGETRSIAGNMSSAVQQQDNYTKAAQESYKSVLSLSNAFKAMAENTIRKAFDRMLQFDQSISNAQRDFQIMLKGVEDSTAMQDLIFETSKFGMTLEETTKFMGELSEQMRTVDKTILIDMASSLAEIQKATGASMENISSIAGDLSFMGASSETVEEAFQNANSQAKLMGVNTRMVLTGMERNIQRMRQFGFEGGEESLARMAAEAVRLKVNIDSIFDVAERARTIEGSMEMAAQLQLAAGSFANINPLDLLSAARKGPEQLQNILTQMGGDIGEFNEKTGEMKFDPVDADRLRIVADATGMQVTELQNMFTKLARQNQKLSVFPESMFDFEGGKQAKSMMSDLLELKDGKIQMKANIDPKMREILEKQGVNEENFTLLSQDKIKSLMEARKLSTKNLEEQASQNKSFNDAIKALGDQFINLLTFFQPVIEKLSSMINGLTNFLQGTPAWLKEWGAYVTTFVGAIFMLRGSVGKMISGFSGILGGMSKSGGGGGVASYVKKFFGMQKDVQSKTGSSKQGAAGGGFLSGLATGVKSFGKVKASDIMKLTGSLVAIAAGLTAFGYAISTMGGFDALPQLATASLSLVVLGGSIKGLSMIMKNVDVGSLLKASAAMALVGASLVPFAYSMQMMSDIDWTNVLGAIGLLTAVTFGLMGLGALLIGPQAIALAIGAAALIAVGASLAIAAGGLLIAGKAFEKLAQIDWAGFSKMGGALMDVIPGLLGFSAAALMFVNPASLLGLITMIGTLLGLAAVMKPLSEYMTTASKSMHELSSGVNKLDSAISKLKVDKLEDLSNISKKLSTASSFGNIASAIEQVASSFSSSNNRSSSGDRRITIDLKLNGRQIQELLVDDNDLVS